MDWFRWHHGTSTDPKWRLIAVESGQRVADVLAVWALMLERASQNTPRGTIDGWHDRVAAAALDLAPSAVEAIRGAMQGLVLEDNALLGWDRRQPKREDGAAERARQWREQKKQERTQANAAERKGTPEESRGDEKSTDTALPNGSGGEPPVEGEDDEAPEDRRRAFYAVCGPLVRDEILCGNGTRDGQSRILRFVERRFHAGCSLESCATYLRGLALMRDKGLLMPTIKPNHPIGVQFMEHGEQKLWRGRSLWAQAEHFFRNKTLMEDNEPSRGGGFREVRLVG